MKMMIAALMLVSTSAFANSGSGPKFDEIPRNVGKQCSQDRILLLAKDGSLLQECDANDICSEYIFTSASGRQTQTARCEARTEENGGL
ncbi:hypothetical protein ACLSU7_10515 [Bdellovibrio sp. HCB185ZH]|uniref:hypothetical protein n=1 Tax=Bdellovibrio sp. HCB185ZH TaxID=3394235 RepID=UPI0039A68E88